MGIYTSPFLYLKGLIANSAKFREITGAADATLAKNFIDANNIVIPESPTQGNIGLRAAVDFGPFTNKAIAGGTNTYFSSSGWVGMKLFMDWPASHTGTDKEALWNFALIIEKIEEEIRALSGSDIDGLNYNIHEIEDTGIGPEESGIKEENYKFNFVQWIVHWGP